jgi:hypothetical protein
MSSSPLFLLLIHAPSMTTFAVSQVIPAILVAMNSGPPDRRFIFAAWR